MSMTKGLLVSTAYSKRKFLEAVSADDDEPSQFQFFRLESWIWWGNIKLVQQNVLWCQAILIRLGNIARSDYCLHFHAGALKIWFVSPEAASGLLTRGGNNIRHFSTTGPDERNYWSKRINFLHLTLKLDAGRKSKDTDTRFRCQSQRKFCRTYFVKRDHGTLRNWSTRPPTGRKGLYWWWWRQYPQHVPW